MKIVADGQPRTRTSTYDLSPTLQMTETVTRAASCTSGALNQSIVQVKMDNRGFSQTIRSTSKLTVNQTFPEDFQETIVSREFNYEDVVVTTCLLSKE